ncbi:MAG: hypothetical protein WC343_11100 [Bacilli bacterium]|jgi:hypothetical protein
MMNKEKMEKDCLKRFREIENQMKKIGTPQTALDKVRLGNLKLQYRKLCGEYRTCHNHFSSIIAIGEFNHPLNYEDDSHTHGLCLDCGGDAGDISIKKIPSLLTVKRTKNVTIFMIIDEHAKLAVKYPNINRRYNELEKWIQENDKEISNSLDSTKIKKIRKNS